MKVAHIIPTSYLERFHRSDYHLILAHLVLSDPVYANFYRDCVDRGECVILDNSVFELGYPLSFDEMLKALTLTKASIIAGPDYPSDSKLTLHDTLDFINFCPTNVKIMAIPQGKDLDDYVGCYKELLESDRVGLIGIPFKLLDKIFPHISPLLRRIILLDYLKQKGLLKKPIHMLGIADNVLELKLIASCCFPNVIGLDTSSAFVHGAKGIQFSVLSGMNVEKEKTKLDFSISSLNEKQISDIDWNITVMNGWVR